MVKKDILCHRQKRHRDFGVEEALYHKKVFEPLFPMQKQTPSSRYHIQSITDNLDPYI